MSQATAQHRGDQPLSLYKARVFDRYARGEINLDQVDRELLQIVPKDLPKFLVAVGLMLSADPRNTVDACWKPTRVARYSRPISAGCLRQPGHTPATGQRPASMSSRRAPAIRAFPKRDPGAYHAAASWPLHRLPMRAHRLRPAWTCRQTASQEAKGRSDVRLFLRGQVGRPARLVLGPRTPPRHTFPQDRHEPILVRRYRHRALGRVSNPATTLARVNTT